MYMIVSQNYLKTSKATYYYWKLKEKNVCNVTDDFLTLTIESATSEVFLTDIKAI